MMHRGEVKREIYRYLDSLKTERTIGGWAIRDRIASNLDYQVYPNVVLKVAKFWAVLSGGRFDCKNQRKSTYFFEPGIRKVAGTALEGLPVQSCVKHPERVVDID